MAGAALDRAGHCGGLRFHDGGKLLGHHALRLSPTAGPACGKSHEAERDHPLRLPAEQCRL